MPRRHGPPQGTGKGFLHRLDPRIKLLLLLTMLAGLATLHAPSVLQVLSYFAFVLVIAFMARLPVVQIASTSVLIFPFVGFFALMVYWTGDSGRAWAIITKSYLSALTVLICMTATPLSDLLAAAIFFRFPQLLLEITQIIYRYFFVLTEQVKTMQVAFQCRGGNKKQLAFLAFSGMVAVLFGRSYQKASVVNHAMVSRGYDGRLPVKSFSPLRSRELAALLAGLIFAVGLQFIP